VFVYDNQELLCHHSLYMTNYIIPVLFPFPVNRTLPPPPPTREPKRTYAPKAISVR